MFIKINDEVHRIEEVYNDDWLYLPMVTTEDGSEFYLAKDAEVLHGRNEVSNVWSFAKDGKQRFNPKDPRWAKYMRK